MDMLDILSVSASGLTAQRVRMQAVASNMANARTTRTPEGGPYVRQMPVFEAVPQGFGDVLAESMSRVEVIGIEDSPDPPVLVYDPGHPDADADGYVLYPNVNILEEMVDMMTTARTYEANTNVVKVTRDLANAAMSIGRG
jgi:flagellar basal-body rod protein FlgC